MPKSEMHQKQKKKNYILLAILVGVIAMLYALTVVKLGQQ